MSSTRVSFSLPCCYSNWAYNTKNNDYNMLLQKFFLLIEVFIHTAPFAQPLGPPNNTGLGSGHAHQRRRIKGKKERIGRVIPLLLTTHTHTPTHTGDKSIVFIMQTKGILLSTLFTLKKTNSWLRNRTCFLKNVNSRVVNITVSY